MTLLAALIQAESGNQPYEGQLAVGAVVMNRVRSGGYPNSIQGVIASRDSLVRQQPGRVASILAAGPRPAVCRRHRQLLMARL